MNSDQAHQGNKALVAVFDDVVTASAVVEKLHESGFDLKNIELVSHDLDAESPEIKTPKVHETSESSVVDGITKGLKAGLAAGTGAGALTLVLTTFPGFFIGEVIFAGVTGAVLGGIGGVDHAAFDDSVDLPTRDEYKQLLDDGNSLVVLLGTHDEAMRAEEIVKHMPHARSHMHLVHGHEFHEHPSRGDS